MVVAAAATHAAADPIDRTFTLPARTVGAVVDLYASHRAVIVGGITAASTSEASRVAIGYGITDTIEVGLELAFSLHHFQTDQPLTLAGSVTLVHGGALELGVTAGLALAHDSTTRLELGVGARYKLGAQVALVAGGAGIQSNHAQVGTGLGPLAPTALGRQLVLGLRSNTPGGPSSVDLPVGVVVEVTPRLELGLGTSLGHVGLANDASAYTLPIELAALFAASHALDLTVLVDVPDTRTAQLDLVFFGLGARYSH